MMISKVVVEFFRRYEASMPEQAVWRVHGSWVTKQTNMDMTISSL